MIFRFSVDINDVALQQYGIAAALICSGICSLVNVSRIPIPFSDRLLGHKIYLGTGILSVMGTSFTFLPIFEIAIAQMKEDLGISGREAYGKMLGTAMLCGFLETVFSFLPLHWLTIIFPPLVTSITVILIGVALVGTGMKYWAGGVVCADMVWELVSETVAGRLFKQPFRRHVVFCRNDSHTLLNRSILLSKMLNFHRSHRLLIVRMGT